MSISAYSDGLPKGPGLFVRWLIAAPLWIVAFVGVPLGLIFVHAWGAHRADEAFHESVRGWQVESVSEEFHETLDAYLPIYSWLLLALVVVLLANWKRISRWTWIVPIPTVFIAFGTSITTPVGADKLTGLARYVTKTPWLVGATGVVVCLLLVWLAGIVFTRPLAMDIAESSMEVPIPRRGRRPFRTRILVRYNQLMLHRLTSPSGSRSSRYIMLLNAFETAQAGEIYSPTPWQLPGGSKIDLPEGQLVRIVGGGQEWFLPVADAPSAVRVIRARVAHYRGANGPVTTDTPSVAEWEKAQATVKKEREWQRKASFRSPILRSRNGLLIVGVICLIAIVPTLPGVQPGWEPVQLLGTLCFGSIAPFALLRWRQLRRSYRITEQNPLRPGSEPKPAAASRAKLPGWVEQTVL